MPATEGNVVGSTPWRVTIQLGRAGGIFPDEGPQGQVETQSLMRLHQGRAGLGGPEDDNGGGRKRQACVARVLRMVDLGENLDAARGQCAGELPKRLGEAPGAADLDQSWRHVFASSMAGRSPGDPSPHHWTR